MCDIVPNYPAFSQRALLLTVAAHLETMHSFKRYEYMTQLEQAIQNAFASQGKPEDVNKVYWILLQSILFIPIKKHLSLDPAHQKEPFSPLFTKIAEHYFMLAFDTMDKLIHWAGSYRNEMNYVELSGRDLIAGMNEGVFLALNQGTELYKEFSSDEIKRLKMIVSKIDQIKAT